MIPLSAEWTPFADLDDQIQHYRLWGLIPPKSDTLRPIMVVDGYLGVCQPCKVVGYQTGYDNWAVIQLEDDLHAIHGEYLAELQPQAPNQTPRGSCFAEVLSHYIVLDIETTGFSRHSDRIIEIAAVEYRYGKKVGEYLTFVNPHLPIPSEITALTGITDADVKDAPDIRSVAPGFLGFIGNLPIIGHNHNSFDIPFLKTEMGAEIPNALIDTLILARSAFPDLPSYKLAYLKDALRLSDGVSHRATADVETTNALLWACISPRRYEQPYLHAKLEASLSSPEKKRAKRKPAKPNQKICISDIIPTQEIDPSSPLYQKSIVFTGELSMPRKEAMQLAVNAGAVLKGSISGKTDFLVVGRQDISIVGDDGMSSKEEKAAALNASGKANIRVITEKQFIELVQGGIIQ